MKYRLYIYQLNFLCYITISLTVDTSLCYMKILFQTELYNRDNVFVGYMAFGNKEYSITLTINNSLKQGFEQYSSKLKLLINYITCQGLHLPIYIAIY